jgi:hypothetical protein
MHGPHLPLHRGEAFGSPSAEIAGLQSDSGLIQGRHLFGKAHPLVQQSLFEGFLGLLVRPRGTLGASLVGIAKLVRYLLDPLIGVLLSVSIEDVPLKNPSIPTVLAPLGYGS